MSKCKPKSSKQTSNPCVPSANPVAIHQINSVSEKAEKATPGKPVNANKLKCKRDKKCGSRGHKSDPKGDEEPKKTKNQETLLVSREHYKCSDSGRFPYYCCSCKVGRN